MNAVLRSLAVLIELCLLVFCAPLPAQAQPDEKQDKNWNLAFNRPVTASGYDKGFPPEYAVDGYYLPYFNPPQCWVRSGKGPNWIEVEFAGKARIERIEILLGLGAPGLRFDAWARLANGKLDSLGRFEGKPDINGVVAFDVPKPRGGIVGVRIDILDPGFPCIPELGLIGRIPGLVPPEDIPTPACLASPDIIFYGGKVITMDPSRSIAEAVAVEGQHIHAIGAESEILPMAGCTKLVDLEGRSIMPGFVDAHTHVLTDSSFGATIEDRQSVLLANGITTIGNMYTEEAFLHEIDALNAAGALRVRVNLYLNHNTNCGGPMGDWYMAYRPSRDRAGLLRVSGVKIFSDGGSCNLPAFSFEILPGNRGDLYLTGPEMAEIVMRAQSVGYQVAIHAIGDRAIDNALQALELALGGGPNVLRHRIEHNSVINPDDYSRYGAIGVVATISSEFPSCTPFGEPSPEPYRDWEWPYRGLLAANPGLHMAWHGDAGGDPGYSLNPFIHLFSFVTRYDVNEATGEVCPPAEWLADDVFPVDQALGFMTNESAYALARETEVGSLEIGKFADLIIPSADPLTTAPEELKDIHVLMTMVGGSTEYCAPGADFLCP